MKSPEVVSFHAHHFPHAVAFLHALLPLEELQFSNH